jgi:hypothetical protein
MTHQAKSASRRIADLELIKKRIIETRATIAGIAPHRDDLLVRAASGENSAIKALYRMRAAENELQDLMAAEPVALAAVEADERAARNEAIKVRKEQLATERIAAAEQITRALAEAQVAFDRFKSLGAELLGLAVTPGSVTTVSQAETIAGLSRIKADLPAMWNELFPTALVRPDARYSLPLIETERLLWFPHGEKAA